MPTEETTLESFQKMLPKVLESDKASIDKCYTPGGGVYSTELTNFWLERKDSSYPCKTRGKPMLLHETSTSALPGILYAQQLLPSNELRNRNIPQTTGEFGGGSYAACDPHKVSFWDLRTRSSLRIINGSRCSNHYDIPITLIICEDEFKKLTKSFTLYKGSMNDEVCTPSLPLEFVSCIAVPNRYIQSFKEYLAAHGLTKPTVIPFGTISYESSYNLFNSVVPYYFKELTKKTGLTFEEFNEMDVDSKRHIADLNMYVIDGMLSLAEVRAVTPQERLNLMTCYPLIKRQMLTLKQVRNFTEEEREIFVSGNTDEENLKNLALLGQKLSLKCS